MKRLNDLELFGDFHLERDLINKSGTEANIFLISGYAAKISKEDAFSNNLLKDLVIPFKEYRIAREFFDGGVSVPEPKGLYAIKDNLGEVWPAFVMDYLNEDYININKLDKYGEALDLWFLELRKTEKFNYYMPDSRNKDNAMYSKKRRDVKLIDFRRYQKID
ncbi:MAG: hypothetical protein PF542_03215 [Nanoarchaeota archaeon]|jgi:hypothetical protein|nr:hypothetical protein [Nanoarchaeota archaeon]